MFPETKSRETSGLVSLGNIRTRFPRDHTLSVYYYLWVVWRCIINQSNLIFPSKVMNEPQTRFVEHAFCGHSSEKQRKSFPIFGQFKIRGTVRKLWRQKRKQNSRIRSIIHSGGMPVSKDSSLQQYLKGPFKPRVKLHYEDLESRL